MKTYYNLTASKGKRCVYFRSTDVEQHNYHRLLWSVPDEWLYLLSQNKQIMIIDKSSNKRGKIERIFIPVLNDFLTNFCTTFQPIHLRFKHHFWMCYDAIRNDKSLYTKYKFWQDKIKNPVNIKAKTIHVKKEKSIIDNGDHDD